MGKPTKLRQRNSNKPASSESLEDRLSRIENLQAKSSSNVLKYAFFFFMGMGLTVLLYPEISQTLGALRSTGETTNEKTQPVESVETIEDEIILDDDDDDDGLERNADEPERSNNQSATTFKYSDKNQESVKSVPLKFEQADLMEDEISDSNVNTEEAVKSVPLTLERIDSFEDETDNEYDLRDNSQGNKNVNEKIRNDEKLKSDKVESIGKEKKKIVKEIKINGEQNKEKRNNQKKKNSLVTHNQKQESGEQKLPKEILDFKPTILKGVTPKKIFADGRRIPPMELLPQKPNNSSVKVWMFEEFLSEEECDGLIRVHNRHVEEQSKQDPLLCFDSVSTLRKHLRSVGNKTPVTPRDFTPGTKCVNATFSQQLKDWLKGNWSYSTAFYPGESRFASIYEQRVKEAMGLLPENGGKFQITSYPKGIGYKSHTDCIEDNEDKRDRVATVLVYLDTVSEGGETMFPELGIWVRPRKARALVWNNMDENGKCEPLSIHKANKVENGRKIILQRWYYYKSFYSLGKRPPEPPLPQRNSGQPRVSCDEYEHGSCRWYDEWNFEHMVEYERQKYTLI